MRNSKAAMFAAIEIHNKPLFPYRYQVVVLLVLNSWELLLKAYIYKNLKKVKLFHKDGTTKQFPECLGCVKSDIGRDFSQVAENLEVLYFYRNKIAHFFVQELDLVVFSLLKKNITFYSHFLKSKFSHDLSEVDDLILLPIGFKKLYSPLDFLSTASSLTDGPRELKAFIQTIIDSTKKLSNEGVEEPIIVDFRLNLTNENRIKNADIIAGVNNATTQTVNFAVNKEDKKFKISSSSDATPIAISRDRTKTTGVLLHEEISEGIFDEINNVIETNRILSKGTNTFQLGQPLYYRIYAERQHVDKNICSFELLAHTGIQSFYAPFLFWLTQLPCESIVRLMLKLWDQNKAPYINSLPKLAVLCGPSITKWLREKLDAKFQKTTQPPDFFYTSKKVLDSKIKDPILRVLGASSSRKIELPNAGPISYSTLTENPATAAALLSDLSMSIFKGRVDYRGMARDLDYLSYGSVLVLRSDDIQSSFERILTSELNI